MSDRIEGYIVCSQHETDRAANVEQLLSLIPHLQKEEAVYPSRVKVPFKQPLLDVSFARTGHRLNEGELGCLLSHRSIWRKIVSSDASADQLFLVLESDSSILEPEILRSNYAPLSNQYDLFFWGAWEGHMQLFRSTKRKLSGAIYVGEPFLKTVYCTYGYSLNKKAAAHLLQKTKMITHPVDQFKYYVQRDELRIGGVEPEMICTVGKTKSYIRAPRNQIMQHLFLLLLDVRNWVICFFK